MRFAPILLALLFILCASLPARAFRQPPTNLGATSFLDGGGAPPGLFVIPYIQLVEGSAALDDEGKRIPGGARVSALVSLTQVYLLTHRKMLGGNLALDLVVPLIAPGGSGSIGPFPVTANRAGLGDVVLGPAIQWNGHALFGRPYHHRFETYAVLPTGRYDRAYLANPGSNLISVEPYYAFTWLFSDAWEASARLHYAFHGVNRATDTRPGQAFHLNYAVSRALLPLLRLGVAGYWLQQASEDRVAGVRQSGSKERVFAAGPGAVLHAPGASFVISHQIESAVRNRFRGSRTTLQVLLAF